MRLPGVPVNPEQILKFKYNELEFEFDHWLATASRKKNINRTYIDGRDGSIKEYIGQDDWQITFTGTITGRNGQRPLNDILALRRILDINDIFNPVAVINSYVNDILQVYSIIIESYTLPQEPGGWAYQSFIINALGDKPIELKAK